MYLNKGSCGLCSVVLGVRLRAVGWSWIADLLRTQMLKTFPSTALWRLSLGLQIAQRRSYLFTLGLKKTVLLIYLELQRRDLEPRQETDSDYILIRGLVGPFRTT